MQQVWCKQLLKEKNITLAFVYTAKSETSLRLKLAASNEYQVFVNGKFLAYGPMRSAHGYSHIRTYPLVPDENGRIAAAVLVCGAHQFLRPRKRTAFFCRGDPFFGANHRKFARF